MCTKGQVLSFHGRREGCIHHLKISGEGVGVGKGQHTGLRWQGLLR